MVTKGVATGLPMAGLLSPLVGVQKYTTPGSLLLFRDTPVPKQTDGFTARFNTGKGITLMATLSLYEQPTPYSKVAIYVTGDVGNTLGPAGDQLMVPGEPVVVAVRVSAVPAHTSCGKVVTAIVAL